jgi:hypothetical protein
MPKDAAVLLARAPENLTVGGRLSVGIALKREPRKLVLAYNGMVGGPLPSISISSHAKPG